MITRRSQRQLAAAVAAAGLQLQSPIQRLDRELRRLSLLSRR